MNVKRENLLLIACIVWCLAGVNILRFGVIEYAHYLTIINVALSFIVFILFRQLIFEKLVNKHTGRIAAMTEEKEPFYRFFDKKTYIIMIIMISSGVALRASGVASHHFIAVFYTGLGAALMFAGIHFGYNYSKELAHSKELARR